MTSYERYADPIHRRLYISWRHALLRCTKPDHPQYKDYGSRGIMMSEAWNDFENFHRDMRATYKVGLTLERIDNSLGYSKENCRWATRKEQALNRRSNVFVSIDGKVQTLSQWIEELHLKRSTVTQRFNTYKWDLKRSLELKGDEIVIQCS